MTHWTNLNLVKFPQEVLSKGDIPSLACCQHAGCTFCKPLQRKAFWDIEMSLHSRMSHRLHEVITSDGAYMLGNHALRFQQNLSAQLI